MKSSDVRFKEIARNDIYKAEMWMGKEFQQYYAARYFSLETLREFDILLSAASISIIGFSIPFLLNANHVKHRFVYFVGIWLLLYITVTCILNLARLINDVMNNAQTVIHSEEDFLNSLKKEAAKLSSKPTQQHYGLYVEKTNAMHEAQEKFRKSNYKYAIPSRNSWWFGGVFILGLFLILVSIY